MRNISLESIKELSSFKFENLQDSLFNPYATTFGKTHKVEALRDALLKASLAFSANEDRGIRNDYGLDFGQFKPVIITGKTQEEKNLPPFELPFMYLTHKDELAILVDLRDYVKDIKPDANSYDELMAAMSRPVNAQFLFRLSAIMAAFAEGDFSLIPFKDSLKIYVYTFIKIIRSIISIDNLEEDKLRVCLAVYFYLLRMKGTIEAPEVEGIAQNIKLNCFILNLDVKDIREMMLSIMCEALNVVDSKLKSIDTLTEYLTTYLKEDKASKLRPGIIANALNNLWYGPGKSFASISCIENLPLFLSMVEISIKESTFKISKLGQIVTNTIKGFDKNNFCNTLQQNFRYTF